MPPYPSSFLKLVDELARLPGVGTKTAQRLAFHLLKGDPLRAKNLAQALQNLHQTTHSCRQCFNLAEAELCTLCADSDRDTSLLCVVEEPQDVSALERTGEFKGLYHLLLGSISPMNGIGPDDLKVKELLARLDPGSKVKEVILATNADVEGEATALYLARLLKPLGLKVTRLASGLPMGGDLEYSDEVTLARALQGRREV
jgi:recombination protein RecR